MTTEESGTRDWRNVSLIALAIAVTILLGVIVGYIASGGLSAPTTTLSAAGTTTTIATTSAPPTTEASTTTSSAPATSDPPGQLTVPAGSDTYIDASDPAQINGTAPVLQVENDSPELKQALIRFDVGGIPQGATINSATLRLFFTQATTSTLFVHLVEGEWNEPETSASSAPLIGDRVGTGPSGTPQGVVEVDVTAAVTGPGPINFYLVAGGDDSIEMGSRESGANAPALIVSYQG